MLIEKFCSAEPKEKDVHKQLAQIANSSEVKIKICKRCGRKLKDIESINLGYGKTCYKKVLDSGVHKPLFTKPKK